MRTLPVVARLGVSLTCVSILFGCTKNTDIPQSNVTLSKVDMDQTTSISSATVSLTTPAHLIFVWFENKGFSQIVGSSSAPYINSLIKKGTLFTNAYGVTHPSYPNYVAWFSGSTQGITSDACIDGTPFTSQTLWNTLSNKSVSFRWYSEGLPKAGSRVCTYGRYVEKHNPTTIFLNTSRYISRPLSEINLKDTTTYSKLPRVMCITPNLDHDMHDGTISEGDTWLKNNLSRLVEWCRIHNSIFVVYFDEDNRNYGNRIPVVAVGQHVKAAYQLSTTYNHYNFTRTVCAMFNASTSWSSNVNSKSVITGCWK